MIRFIQLQNLGLQKGRITFNMGLTMSMLSFFFCPSFSFFSSSFPLLKLYFPYEASLKNKKVAFPKKEKIAMKSQKVTF